MLKLSESQKDLGRIRLGQPKVFTVNIGNIGDQDIEITSVKVGCGKCTRAYVEKTTIPAKGSEPLRVTFTPDSPGINRKSVTINKTLVFTFVANVYN